MNVVIERVEITSFGKLKNAVVTANSGINILSAPNESGKSTLAAFIKFVFYGYAGTRKQSLTDNERDLYTPWDSEISSGNVYIVADGEKYKIHRRCTSSGKEVCEITRRSTGRQEFVGEVPGEVFFGVGEEIFARTLFFRQLTLPQSKDEILADRLRDIAISADEQVSTQKALKRLNDAKNELKSKMGNGLIPDCEKVIEGLDEKITESASLRREVVRISEEIEKREKVIKNAENMLSKLRKERLNIEKYDAFLQMRTINRLSLEENLAREEYEKSSAGLKQQADKGAFGELSAKQAEFVAEQRTRVNIKASLQEAEAEIEEIKAQMPFDLPTAKKAKRVVDRANKNSRMLFIISAACIVLGLLVYFAVPTAAGFIGVALGLVVAAVGAVMMGKPAVYAKELGLKNAQELNAAIQTVPLLEQNLAEATFRYDDIHDKYTASRLRCAELKKSLDEQISKYADVKDGENYSEKIEHILSLSVVSGEKLALWRAKKEEFEKASEGIDVKALSRRAEGAEKPEREKQIVDRELNFYTQQLAQLTDMNHNDQLECAALEAKSGDPAALVSKRDSYQRRLDEYRLKHKAYETAIRMINEASDYMKSMVAPRIGARADEYFTAATGGKYNSFEVDTRMAMSVGDDFRRNCDYLSAGTRDSAYLSLRLALADMLFGGSGVPILLDDAFGRIDDNRLRMISGALGEASKKHQIFILTHGDRERSAFEDIGVGYTEISIKNT